MKFMVDDYGPEGHARGGGAAARPTARGLRAAHRRRRVPSTTSASTRSSQPGLFYVGAPVHLGLVSGDQMIAVADLAERIGGDVRLTRQQNLVITGVPEDRVEETVATIGEIGFPVGVNRVRASAIACTGEPHCNFAVTGATKPRLDALVRAPRGAIRRRRSPGSVCTSDGCPHACAHHWVGDIGFQGDNDA